MKKESEEKKQNYHRQEIRYGAFERTLALPAEVDSSKANAELENGILTITSVACSSTSSTVRPPLTHESVDPLASARNDARPGLLSC